MVAKLAKIDGINERKRIKRRCLRMYTCHLSIVGKQLLLCKQAFSPLWKSLSRLCREAAKGHQTALPANAPNRLKPV